MKLFTPKEVSTIKNETEIRQAHHLTLILAQKQHTLEQIREKLEPERQRLERDFLSFTTNIQTKKSNLLKEVTDLEARKEDALKSLNQEWYDLSAKQVEIADLEVSLKQDKAEVIKEREQLTEGLMQVSDTKQLLDEWEEKIARHEQGIRQQLQALAESTKDLNTKWTDYRIAVASILKREAVLNDVVNLEQRKAAALTPLTALQTDLETKRDSLAKREAFIGAKEQEIGTLDAQFQAFKHKTESELGKRQILITKNERLLKEQWELLKASEAAIDNKHLELEMRLVDEKNALKLKHDSLDAETRKVYETLEQTKTSQDRRQQTLDRQASDFAQQTMELEARRTQVESDALALLKREKDLQIQETNLTALDTALADKLEAFQTSIKDQTAKQRDAFSFAASLKVREDNLTKKVIELRDLKRQLDDRQATLT